MSDALIDDLLHLAQTYDDPAVRSICQRAAQALSPSVMDDHATVAIEVVDEAITGHLCSLLANRVAEQRGRRPKITSRWIKDMGLLLRRGPKHVDATDELDPEAVAQMIHRIFTQLAEPNARGFCWADQIRSPAALRDHWEQAEVALRRLPSDSPDTQQVVDAVKRLKALGL